MKKKGGGSIKRVRKGEIKRKKLEGITRNGWTNRKEKQRGRGGRVGGYKDIRKSVATWRPVVQD